MQVSLWDLSVEELVAKVDVLESRVDGFVQREVDFVAEIDALRLALDAALDKIEEAAEEVPGSEDWDWADFDRMRKL